MNRIEIINSLIAKNNYKTYLEIGIQNGSCFSEIKIDNKIGVDPDTGSAATIHKTSDEFFKTNKQKFDIIFLDGLHHADQIERDIFNSLACLKSGGTIVCHDMLPTSKRMQQIPLQEQGEWTGNVWETWVKLRRTNPDLEMRCINSDWGTSIIRRGKQELLDINYDPTYEDFVIHKEKFMNIISVEQFKSKYL